MTAVIIARTASIKPVMESHVMVYSFGWMIRAAIRNPKVARLPKITSKALKPSPINCFTTTALKKILLKSAKYFASKSSRLFMNDFSIITLG